MTEIRVHAVLCDMDGTLVDSNALVDAMWNEFAAAHELDAEEVRHFAHGRPSTATIARYLSDEQEIAYWTEHIHMQEGSNFDGVVEIPGAVDFTKSLPPARWAVVTSALAGPARGRIQAAGISVPRVLIGADDVTQGKPDPEGYARAARELFIPARECVVLEDTDAGIEAGLAAGCMVIVVGANRSPVTQGLPRVMDLTEVQVRVDSDDIILTVPEDESESLDDADDTTE